MDNPKIHIKESWKEHPLYKQGKIELVPTDWVWKYYGRDVSPETIESNFFTGTEFLWFPSPYRSARNAVRTLEM